MKNSATQNNQPLDNRDPQEIRPEGGYDIVQSRSSQSLTRSSELEPPGSQLDEAMGRALAHVDRDARQTLEHTQQTQRGLLRWTRKGRELRQHEETLLRTLYQEREQALAIITSARKEELRSMLDAFLRIHGTRLEVASTQELVRQRQRFESELQRYSEDFQRRMTALYARLDQIQDTRIKGVVERDVDRLVRGYVVFNEQLDTRFQQVLERSVQG